MKDRKDIDKKYTWNLDVIYSNTTEFDKDYDLVIDKINSLKKYENTMMDNSDNFYDSIRLSFEIERLIDKLYCYVNLSFDLDTSNNNKQELCEKISNLRSKYSENSYFIVPSILKNDYSVIEKYIKENPLIKNYEISIREIYRYKEHILSDAEEKLLSSISKMIGNSYDTYELFKDCDMSFDSIEDENGKKVELNNSNYSLYIESKDRRVRKDTFNTLYKEYKKYTNTFASLISSNMKELSTLAKINKYNSAIEMSLYADDVDIKVYNNLIDSVHKHIDYIYDYYKLKKDILNLNDIHLYDVYVPIGNILDKKYSYEEAKEVILKVLEVFEDEYITKVKEALDNRWIDVYPTKNKRTGGYSGGSYDTYPYILLNYQDKYNDMSTLIHEMGHSMHSYYSRNYNTYQNSEYRIFVAEVASTVNELLLAKHLLKTTDDKSLKKSLLAHLMDMFKATIYRQTMFAEFEEQLHQAGEDGKVLTSEFISDIYLKLVKKYHEPVVVVDDQIRYEWERISHFYTPFYVYKYATGLACACHIVTDILSGKEHAVENYIAFLKDGSKHDPIDTLKIAGVDVLSKDTMKSALEMFSGFIREYQSLNS